MKGETRLTRPRDFQAVHSEGTAWANGPILMKALPNGERLSRYGFSVSRRVGGAVTRNLVRRRLREILRLKKLSGGYDMVFVARPSAASASYLSLDSAVTNLLVRAKIVVRESTEPGSASGGTKQVGE